MDKINVVKAILEGNSFLFIGNLWCKLIRYRYELRYFPLIMYSQIISIIY